MKKTGWFSRVFTRNDFSKFGRQLAEKSIDLSLTQAIWLHMRIEARYRVEREEEIFWLIERDSMIDFLVQHVVIGVAVESTKKAEEEVMD